MKKSEKLLSLISALSLMLGTAITAGAVDGNNSSEVMPGDVNGDSIINIRDVSLVQKSLVGLSELDIKAKEAADVNGDGKIDIMDITVIQKYISGVIDGFAEKDSAYLSTLIDGAEYKNDDALNRDIAVDANLELKKDYFAYRNKKEGVSVDEAEEVCLITSAKQFHDLTGTTSSQYDEKFFESKALIYCYDVCLNYDSETFIDYVGVENNTMFVRVCRVYDGDYTDDGALPVSPALRPWLLYYSVDKSAVSDVNNLVVYQYNKYPEK